MQAAHGAPRRLSAKRHPVVLVRNFLAIQFASAGAYALVGAVTHVSRIWRSTPFNTYIPFSVAQALFVFIAEGALIMYIFLSWYRANLYVYDGQVNVHEGILWRTMQRIPVPLTADVSIRQNMLGRLTKYGTVVIRNGRHVTKLVHVPEPQQFVAAIRGAAGVPVVPADPVALLDQPEHDGLEFKGSLRWDGKMGKVNRALEKSALKTIAAFMNSRGGHLVLGVADDREVSGVAADIATLARKDRDGFETHLGNLFNATVGPHLRGCMTVSWASHGGREFCVVSVAPAAEPAYVRSDNLEEFFVRSGNGTASLTISQAQAYLRGRFTV